MEVFYSLCRETSPTVVALGHFDGIHIGHEKVIEKAVSYRSMGLKPIVITFQKNPKFLLSGRSEHKLMSEKDKIRVFDKLGIVTLYIIDFLTVKDLSAEVFVENVLYNTLNVRQAVCGFNYTFGAGGKANPNDLIFLGKRNKIGVDVVKPVMYRNEVVSSSRIRDAVTRKDLSNITEMSKYILDNGGLKHEF